jgi:hypothetical protein
VKEDPEKGRQDIVQAFRQQQPLTAKDIAAEVQPFFDELGAALRGGDPERLLEYYNLERMIDEFVAMQVFPKEISNNRRQFVTGMRQGMRQSLGRIALFLKWDETEIKHLKRLEGNEAIVITRHRLRGQPGSMKMRWWVTKEQGRWQVFDFEDLDSGTRVSTVAASLAAQGVGQLPTIAPALRHLQEAMMAIAIERDANKAEQCLQRIGPVRLPNQIEAFRFLARGSCACSVPRARKPSTPSTRPTA